MTADLAGVAAMKVGAGIMEGQDESGKQVLQIDEEDQEQDQEQGEQQQLLHHQQEENGRRDEQVKEHTLMAATDALAAMAVGEKKGQEDEEEECSVCLNVIDSTDADDPPGPPLLCGHRYHAFCLFWVERCTNKCIEPTCPYCRAPLQGYRALEEAMALGSLPKAVHK
jgi:hypothetical protein